jgi:hypothetical protein
LNLLATCKYAALILCALCKTATLGYLLKIVVQKDERNDKNKCAFLFQFLGALVEAGQNEVQADTSGISLPHGSYCPCAIFMA